jgi:hypothetical protein
VGTLLSVTHLSVNQRKSWNAANNWANLLFFFYQHPRSTPVTSESASQKRKIPCRSLYPDGGFILSKPLMAKFLLTTKVSVTSIASTTAGR